MYQATRAARAELFDGAPALGGFEHLRVYVARAADGPGGADVLGHALVCLEPLRVYVARAADGRRVAEVLGHALDGRDQVLLRLTYILTTPYLGQLDGCQQRPAPRPKVLRGELLAGCGLDVVVHVARIDRTNLAVLVNVLEELRAADGLDVADERG